MRSVFPYFLLWVKDLVFFELRFGFLMKNCIYDSDSEQDAQVSQQFWAGFRRISVGFNKILVYNTPPVLPPPPQEFLFFDSTQLVVSKRFHLTIYRVFHEESESELKKYQILHPD